MQAPDESYAAMSIDEIAVREGVCVRTVKYDLMHALRKIQRRKKDRQFVRLVIIAKSIRESRRDNPCSGH